MIEGDNPLSAPYRFGEGELHFPSRPGDYHPFHLCQLFHSALNLSCLGILSTESFDEAHLLLYLEILSFGRSFRNLNFFLSGYNETIVIATVKDALTLLDGKHFAYHSIQECPVVRNDQDRPTIASQVTLKPNTGLQIEMVYRLIKQEHIRGKKKKFGQCSPHQPPTAEVS